MPLNLRLKSQGFSPGPKGQTAQASLQGHQCPCSLRFLLSATVVLSLSFRGINAPAPSEEPPA